MTTKDEQGVADRATHSVKEAAISAAATGAGVVAQPKEALRRMASAVMSKRSLVIGLAFAAGVLVAARWRRK